MTRGYVYDPWIDLEEFWPEANVVIEELSGDLLGEVRATPEIEISIRADSSPAQQRCTLAHELVHLERGLDDCGQWQHREERQVHTEVARRLIPLKPLLDALRSLGGSHDISALAAFLHVDHETAAVRLDTLTATERRWLRTKLRSCSELFNVA
jgi:IrrE N-terminal-like domain